MSKQILPQELAEICTALLVKPQLLGQLETSGQFEAFMKDIGQVVANHCGGQINFVHGALSEEAGPADDELSAMLSVAPNDSLPSINRNVWSFHDLSGWEDEQVEGVEVGVPVTREEASTLRSKIAALLLEAA